MHENRLVVLCLVFCGCSHQENPARFQGYVEGEPVRVAAAIGGRLDRLMVARGTEVAAGAPLFALDAESELAALQEAQAHLADIEKGQRPAELDIVRAQLAQARAQRELSAAQLKRQQPLREQGVISQDQFDQVATQHQRDRARVDELTAQLRSGEQAGRADALKAAQAVVARNRWQLAQKTRNAPAAGRVEDVYYRVGEWVAAGAPVLSLLPPQNRKLRFFAPQSDLESVKVGTTVSVHCDGCGADFSAAVRFIAPQAEYTPPVIYSDSARQKLVFLIEAWPEPGDALKLRPGQPVEVRLSQ